jgi:hypothetical protein
VTYAEAEQLPRDNAALPASNAPLSKQVGKLTEQIAKPGDELLWSSRHELLKQYKSFQIVH